ncbi:ubiquitin carboxyl-terminal hydrolase 47-like isoform X1 [Lates japonicus]|uniref:ubiquitinyl hydrolase 1 n=1 Tax=Lates japonicus TaxID=270547 RepID=A0AAD3R1J3_LATJO|nr:ubiquitin carboxyl-terminal hydrolase 47-like isoform X1 [Lates japonicus]
MYSVEKGFKRIFQTKSYSGDNMVYCNNCKKKTDATSTKTYQLYGMVNHIGSLRGGHYTATILLSEDKMNWHEFDDAHIKKVEEQPFAETRTHNSSTAYLLMYRELKDENSPQPVKKNPLFIFLIAAGCVLVVLLVLILTTMNKY